jgi:hypothetical protein
LAIVTLILWVITASAGIALLSTGGAAKRAAANAQPPTEMPEAAEAPASTLQAAAASPVTGTQQAAAAAPADPPAKPVPARLAALPRTADGKPPPVPRVRVTTPPGEHPLLEFCHPALALTGLACWLMFVFVHYRPLAWISFGILLVTIGLGVSWLSWNVRDARRHAIAAWRFPPRLVATHGLAAAISITLTVLTALIASRG